MDEGQLKRRFYPESNISGFTHVDGTVTFFQNLAAIVRTTDTVLDFGAGRGEPLLDDPVEYRRRLGMFQGRCAHLDGCDVDPVVLQNPFLDRAQVLQVGAPLPYEDNRFDIIFSRYVFEHIADVPFVCNELLRVLKPGGTLAATTPNKWGYIGMSARLVPNRLHVRVLSRSQPDRKPEDVFPVQYRLNTAGALKAAFGGEVDVFISRKAPEPAYHFGRPAIYRAMKWVDKHTPARLLPVLDIYIRKH